MTSYKVNPATGPSTLVRIVDDQLPVREAIADLLASVGMASRSYSSAAEFLRDDDPTRSGCVVLDVRMPDMSGFDLLSVLSARGWTLPIVFVTGHGDIAMAVRAMKAGAVDFLAKPFDDQVLIDAINAASRTDLQRRVSSALKAEAVARVKSLTEGERVVLDLIVQGQRNKQIAAAQAVSEITVKVRRARIMQKLAVSSMAELVRVYDRIQEAKDEVH